MRPDILDDNAGEINTRDTHQSLVRVSVPPVMLDGSLALPAGAFGVVLFAHGSGSSRHRPRNRCVAEILHQGGVGTLLFDSLAQEEEEIDARTAKLRFDIPLLTQRLVGATDWLRQANVEYLRPTQPDP